MSIPYIAKYAGPTIGDATKDILREYGMTGHEIGSRAECQYTFMEFSEFVQRKVGDDIWHSLKYPTSAIYKAVADYMKEEEYQVDHIISSNGKTGSQRQWLVRWKGYDECHDSWLSVGKFLDAGITERFDDAVDEARKELDNEDYLSDSDESGDSETWRDRWDQMYDIYKRHVANHEEMIDGLDTEIIELNKKIRRRDGKIESLKMRARKF
tara:strand:- start:151 stop:783 length:633 start_codon:yes stop_codon:yes gene_type:complete